MFSALNAMCPVIQMTCVTQCAVQILKLGSIARFLEKALDPPSEKAVSLAIKNLTDLVRVRSQKLLFEESKKRNC